MLITLSDVAETMKRFTRRKVIEALNSEMVSTNDDPEQNEIINEMDDLPCNESPELKLPKTDTQWKEADMFFRSGLHTKDINNYNLTETLERMNHVTLPKRMEQ